MRLLCVPQSQIYIKKNNISDRWSYLKQPAPFINEFTKDDFQQCFKKCTIRLGIEQKCMFKSPISKRLIKGLTACFSLFYSHNSYMPLLKFIFLIYFLIYFLYTFLWINITNKLKYLWVIGTLCYICWKRVTEKPPISATF